MGDEITKAVADKAIAVLEATKADKMRAVIAACAFEFYAEGNDDAAIKLIEGAIMLGDSSLATFHDILKGFTNV